MILKGKISWVNQFTGGPMTWATLINNKEDLLGPLWEHKRVEKKGGGGGERGVWVKLESCTLYFNLLKSLKGVPKSLSLNRSLHLLGSPNHELSFELFSFSVFCLGLNQLNFPPKWRDVDLALTCHFLVLDLLSLHLGSSNHELFISFESSFL